MREKSLKRLLFTMTSFIISVNCCNFVFANTPTKPEQEEEIFSSNPNLFIPSALRNTPEYEIEIISPKNIKDEAKTQPTTPKTITIKKGDTLYSIAKSENIKVSDLAEFNKLSSPYILKIGQIITIPGKEKIETAKIIKDKTNLDKNKSFIEGPKIDFVIIKKGDTIYSIAKNNNVPLKDLIIRNNLKPPYILSIGQKIYIPNTAFHIVQKEDTVYSISRKYNVNLNSLVKLNNLKDPFTIIAGQKIILPAPNVDVKLTQKEKSLTQTNTNKITPKPVEQTTKPTNPQTQAQSEIKTPTTMEKEIEISVSTQKQEETKQKVNKIIVRPAPLTSQKFMWPVKGKVISEFGVKNNGKRNDGINISAPIGTKVSSVENGIVAYSGNELKGLGNLVIIKHDKDYMTIYAHNDELKVKKGDIVKRGDTIATVGKTGRVTTPQLHFEVRQKTKSINPTTILERR